MVCVGDAVFLIVLETSLALSGVALAVMVVDAWTQVLSVELEAEVVLFDLLFVVAVGTCRVVTRLCAVSRVVLCAAAGLAWQLRAGEREP